ncbi:MAG: ribbon-helix-helix domain-containing protein [Hyphomicrobiales bacterium]|nr:ribbon-helix-helix domain-containing protein [Hyphomicrobiales bacterium]
MRRPTNRAADRAPRAASAVVKRSLTIAGHSTSVSLEEAFWRALRAAAARRGASLPALVAAIDDARAGANLSSAIRVFLLAEVTAQNNPAPEAVGASGTMKSDFGDSGSGGAGRGNGGLDG